MLEKVLSILVLDSDVVGGSVAGSVTESIIHPRKGINIVSHFVKALCVGWALAVFVSPAISERFNLNKSESVAISFIGGYSGIRLMVAVEKIILTKLKEKIKE
jgi:hypothetical protein